MIFVVTARLIPNENSHAEYKQYFDPGSTKYSHLLKTVTVRMLPKDIPAGGGISFRDAIAIRLRKLYNCKHIYEIEVSEDNGT